MLTGHVAGEGQYQRVASYVKAGAWGMACLWGIPIVRCRSARCLEPVASKHHYQCVSSYVKTGARDDARDRASVAFICALSSVRLLPAALPGRQVSMEAGSVA